MKKLSKNKKWGLICGIIVLIDVEIFLIIAPFLNVFYGSIVGPILVGISFVCIFAELPLLTDDDIKDEKTKNKKLKISALVLGMIIIFALNAIFIIPQYPLQIVIFMTIGALTVFLGIVIWAVFIQD